jgi:thiol-disulfide isomerase/thioredoxin
MNLKILYIFSILLILIMGFSFAETQNLENETIEINYFYMSGCSACAKMKPELEKFVEKYNITLNTYEISLPQNSKLFQEKLEEYFVPVERRGYVPTVFIKNDFFIGYSGESVNNIERIILREIENSDFDYQPINEGVGETTKIDTTILGILPVSVHLAADSFLAILFSTIIIAFFDSLNICSMTVLVFLIVYLVSIGSMKRVLKTGLLFTTVIYLFYFMFMLILTEIINAFILDYGFLIRLILVIFCGIVGLLLIKDYFFYGKWLSLRVPDSTKPILEKYLKQATLISTIIFAILASLVELPCTAIFPFVYSTILAEGMVVGVERIAWIALYNLVYVVPLLLIVFATYFSWVNIANVDEKIQKSKKALKLITGLILLLIGLYFALPIL